MSVYRTIGPLVLTAQDYLINEKSYQAHINTHISHSGHKNEQVELLMI